jgi:flagellar biosynthetic protein FliR
MLAQILPADLFSTLLVFVRLAATRMIIPGFGEIYISQRVRFTLAFMLTLVVAPVVAHTLPGQPATPVELVLMIGGEAVVGVLIGASARLMISALHVAGTVIAFQSSLAYASTVDPTQGTQSALVATLMIIIGTVLIFAANLHFLMLQAMVDSYQLFPPTALPPFQDFMEAAVNFVAGSFKVGMQIAAPFIVYGLVLYMGMGLMARLMPQMQVFFIMLPLQIISAFFVLMVSLGAIMVWFLDHYENGLAQFLM